jgi:hypothetical protein
MIGRVTIVPKLFQEAIAFGKLLRIKQTRNNQIPKNIFLQNQARTLKFSPIQYYKPKFNHTTNHTKYYKLKDKSSRQSAVNKCHMQVHVIITSQKVSKPKRYIYYNQTTD